MKSVDLAQNAYLEIDVPVSKSSAVVLATSADNNAGATFELRVQAIDAEYTTIKIWDAVAHAPTSTLIGASQYGWANTPGAQKARIYRTDASGGTGKVAAIGVLS